MDTKTIYQVDINGFNWLSTKEIYLQEEIPKGWTNVEPPTYPTYKLIFNWETNKWIETATPDEIVATEYGAEDVSEVIKLVKESKIDDLKSECNQRIIDGFALDKEHYSYTQEKQINFQDTYQLFLNNMITEILWNAYVDGEKKRVLLDKDKFQRVYLAGIKHKQDCIIHLNDILIPLVESSTDIEAITVISWGEQKSSFRVSDEKNIAKKVEGLSEDFVAQKSINEQMEGIVLEIADIALLSGL